MSQHQERRKEFEEKGRLWLHNAICGSSLQDLLRAAPEASGPGRRIPAHSRFFEAVTCLPALSELRAIWPDMRPVRMVHFDKARQNNWSLPWHQDRVIAVRGRVDVPGYANWTRKQGDWHCEPPCDILNQMLFVRLHLDPSTAENGAMEIAPGSHCAGKLSAEEVAVAVEDAETEINVAEAGDILVLPMLCLHRSRVADGAGRRRVLRIDLAACNLPAPLEWTT